MIGCDVVTTAVAEFAQTGDASGVVAFQSSETGVFLGFGGTPTAERFSDGVVGEHDGAEEEGCHGLGGEDGGFGGGGGGF